MTKVKGEGLSKGAKFAILTGKRRASVMTTARDNTSLMLARLSKFHPEQLARQFTLTSASGDLKGLVTALA